MFSNGPNTVFMFCSSSNLIETRIFLKFLYRYFQRQGRQICNIEVANLLFDAFSRLMHQTFALYKLVFMF